MGETSAAAASWNCLVVTQVCNVPFRCPSLLQSKCVKKTPLEIYITFRSPWLTGMGNENGSWLRWNKSMAMSANEQCRAHWFRLNFTTKENCCNLETNRQQLPHRHSRSQKARTWRGGHEMDKQQPWIRHPVVGQDHASQEKLLETLNNHILSGIEHDYVISQHQTSKP